jgi:hypothetical protein
MAVDENCTPHPHSVKWLSRSRPAPQAYNPAIATIATVITPTNITPDIHQICFTIRSLFRLC